MLASKVITMQDNSAHGEDSLLSKELGNGEFLDVVMDGVTGHGGEQASNELRDALDQANLDNANDIVSLLSEINDDFYSVGSGRFLLTTVSAVLGRGDNVQVVAAGDSPVFLINQNGYRKLSGNAGGFLHVGVARAIGASQKLGAPSQVEITPSQGDRLLLATDGITDNMTIEELVEVINSASTPEDAAAQIEETIKERLTEGRVPETIGVRFRYDDRTGIIRFF